MSFTTDWKKACIKVEQKTPLGARTKIHIGDTKFILCLGGSCGFFAVAIVDFCLPFICISYS